MEGLIWWGDRLVGLRSCTARPGSVGCNGGVLGRYLEKFSKKKVLVRGQDHCVPLVAERTYWFQREDARGDDEDERNDNQRAQSKDYQSA